MIRLKVCYNSSDSFLCYKNEIFSSLFRSLSNFTTTHMEGSYMFQFSGEDGSK
jgi:hypothetical protein